MYSNNTFHCKILNYSYLYNIQCMLIMDTRLIILPNAYSRILENYKLSWLAFK